MARTAKGTGRDNRRKILDAAMALIGEKGVEKTSLSGIARAAGLSKGTVYYYYASKNDLVFDIADLHMERITTTLFSMIDQARGITWEELLCAYFNTLLSSEARSRLHLYLVREAVSGNDEIKERFQTTYAQWFEMVDRAYDKMPGPKTDREAKARFLVAVVDGFILQTQLAVKKTDIDDIVRLALKVIRE
ncbi:MAG: TetR/AcrR family transcriptional regulator [Desulfobacter sp.]|nr:MAG: TetR/AcrR family transcriptional regulator [Desulfobacter sp.]